MNQLKFASIAFACLIAFGCARQEAPDANGAGPEAEVAAQATPQVEIPAATIAPVNVQITLSPAAKAGLESAKEEISVAATYSGDPKESAIALAGPSGMIDLGKNTQLLSTEGTVVFNQDVIDEKRLAQTEGEVQLTINVTSAKKSGPENLLACPFYWETLAEAGKETVKIHCTLISEAGSGKN